MEDARNARAEQPKTKEQLIAFGNIRPIKNEIFEDSSFGKKTKKWEIYHGCKFINHDFSNTEFVECDFRWSTFINCKGINLTVAPQSNIGLHKLICESPNFINCDFTECHLENSESSNQTIEIITKEQRAELFKKGRELGLNFANNISNEALKVLIDSVTNEGNL